MVCCVSPMIYQCMLKLTLSEAVADHDCKLSSLLQRCHDRDLKKENIRLLLTEVQLVGHFITKYGLKPDPEKLCAVTEIPLSMYPPEIQRYLGEINYLRRFMPHRSDIGAPLSKLTHRNKNGLFNIKSMLSKNSLIVIS